MADLKKLTGEEVLKLLDFYMGFPPIVLARTLIEFLPIETLNEILDTSYSQIREFQKS